MIFPKDKGFKHEAYGAGDIQALLKAQEVRDQKQDEKELEEIITDLNELSVKYGGIGTATTYSGAMENLEETIQEQASTLVEKSITENGTYNAEDDDADGYSSVNVDIPINDNNAKFGVDSNQVATFNGIKSLEKIAIPEGVETIGNNAFQEAARLTEITLPNSLKTIGQNAFQYCKGLTSITIPSNVTSISAVATPAFGNCPNLTKIIVNKPEGSISGAPWGATNATVVWTG